MSLTLTSSHDTTAQNSMCAAVSVSGKGKPPSFGSRIYLFSLHAREKGAICKSCKLLMLSHAVSGVVAAAAAYPVLFYLVLSQSHLAVESLACFAKVGASKLLGHGCQLNSSSTCQQSLLTGFVAVTRCFHSYSMSADAILAGLIPECVATF